MVILEKTASQVTARQEFREFADEPATARKRLNRTASKTSISTPANDGETVIFAGGRTMFLDAFYFVFVCCFLFSVSSCLLLFNDARDERRYKNFHRT